MHFQEIGSKRGMGLWGSGQRQEASSCEYGEEHWGFIKCGEFLE